MKVLTPAKIHLATKSSKSSVHQHLDMWEQVGDDDMVEVAKEDAINRVDAQPVPRHLPCRREGRTTTAQGGQLKLATSCYTKKVLECGYTPVFTMKPCYYQLRVEAERAAERERYERDATATTLVRTRSWLPWS